MRACVARWVFLGEGHPSFLAPLTCLGSHLLGGDVGDQVLGRLLDGLLCGRLGLCTCVRVLEWSKSSRVEKRTRSSQGAPRSMCSLLISLSTSNFKKKIDAKNSFASAAFSMDNEDGGGAGAGMAGQDCDSRSWPPARRGGKARKCWGCSSEHS